MDDVDPLGWIPSDGVTLSHDDLRDIFVALRGLITGTGRIDPNRAHAVEIAVVLSRALER